ncbi:MAG: helix-turn-helix transcriptional regulator, partial [Actinomycetia bacterium]|nr:helix-turn-helix transcriptional regulator [Actinomycetes bacterium]
AELAASEREPYRRTVRHLVLAARAALELDRGNAQEAADLAERYLRSVAASDVIESVEALEVLVRARIALDDVPAADRAARDLEAAAAAIPTTAIRATAEAARGDVLRAQGCFEDARTRLESAIAGLDDAGLRHDAVLAQVALAAVQLDLGDPAGARWTAEAARDAATELGATGEVAAANDLLARMRGGVDGTPEGLTSREVDVVRLMVDGLANADIAAALVLSSRTVERHISNIYLKIGATGPAARAVAIAYARRRGLAR